MPRRPARAWGSVDRGKCRLGMEPRKTTSGCRRCKEKRKATSDTSPSPDVSEPRAVRDPEHARKQSARNPGDPGSGRLAAAGRSASGSLRTHADDARTQEVGRSHSTREPLEQTRPDGCGEGGGKGIDQGESGGRNHACGRRADTGMPSDVNRIRHGALLKCFMLSDPR